MLLIITSTQIPTLYNATCSNLLPGHYGDCLLAEDPQTWDGAVFGTSEFEQHENRVFSEGPMTSCLSCKFKHMLIATTAASMEFNSYLFFSYKSLYNPTDVQNATTYVPLTIMSVNKTM